jgi:hypothetical protein
MIHSRPKPHITATAFHDAGAPDRQGQPAVLMFADGRHGKMHKPKEADLAGRLGGEQSRGELNGNRMQRNSLPVSYSSQ